MTGGTATGLPVARGLLTGAAIMRGDSAPTGSCSPAMRIVVLVFALLGVPDIQTANADVVAPVVDPGPVLPVTQPFTEPVAAPAYPFDRGAVSGIGTAGGPGVYTVQPGDNLTVIAARLGAWLPQLRRDNPLDERAFLRIGQTLIYDNRHIVPPAPGADGDAILINIPQLMLFHYRVGQLQAAYPAAAGKPGWQTPIGDTAITTREKNKPWFVPLSIQAEMRALGQPVLTRVPPGPDNPLGKYWLGLALDALGIHGTNAPASVYGARTHGCVRLQPEHIEALFQGVAVGVPVRIIYAPVQLFSPPGGPIWLEVHPDVYARGFDYHALARQLADEAGVTERIDWIAAESVLTEQQGIARDVALNTQPEYP